MIKHEFDLDLVLDSFEEQLLALHVKDQNNSNYAQLRKQWMSDFSNYIDKKQLRDLLQGKILEHKDKGKKSIINDSLNTQPPILHSQRPVCQIQANSERGVKTQPSHIMGYKNIGPYKFTLFHYFGGTANRGKFYGELPLDGRKVSFKYAGTHHIHAQLISSETSSNVGIHASEDIQESEEKEALLASLLAILHSTYARLNDITEKYLKKGNRMLKKAEKHGEGHKKGFNLDIMDNYKHYVYGKLMKKYLRIRSVYIEKYGEDSLLTELEQQYPSFNGDMQNVYDNIFTSIDRPTRETLEELEKRVADITIDVKPLEPVDIGFRCKTL